MTSSIGSPSSWPSFCHKLVWILLDWSTLLPQGFMLPRSHLKLILCLHIWPSSHRPCQMVQLIVSLFADWWHNHFPNQERYHHVEWVPTILSVSHQLMDVRNGLKLNLSKAKLLHQSTTEEVWSWPVCLLLHWYPVLHSGTRGCCWLLFRRQLHWAVSIKPGHHLVLCTQEWLMLLLLVIYCLCSVAWHTYTWKVSAWL